MRFEEVKPYENNLSIQGFEILTVDEVLDRIEPILDKLEAPYEEFLKRKANIYEQTKDLYSVNSLEAPNRYNEFLKIWNYLNSDKVQTDQIFVVKYIDEKTSEYIFKPKLEKVKFLSSVSLNSVDGTIKISTPNNKFILLLNSLVSIIDPEEFNRPYHIYPDELYIQGSKIANSIENENFIRYQIESTKVQMVCRVCGAPFYYSSYLNGDGHYCDTCLSKYTSDNQYGIFYKPIENSFGYKVYSKDTKFYDVQKDLGDFFMCYCYSEIEAMHVLAVYSNNHIKSNDPNDVTDDSRDDQFVISRCKGCNEYFQLFVKNIRFYKNKGLEAPKRCNTCLSERRLLKKIASEKAMHEIEYDIKSQQYGNF